MKKERNLTEGAVFGNLVAFVLPFLFACFMQAFYSAVDMWTVGHFSSSADLASVNVGAQVSQIVISFIIGSSMGSTVMIGHAVGAKDQRAAEAAVGNSFRLFTVLAVVLTPFLFGFAKPLSVLLKTPEEALPGAVTYVRICGIGVPFIIAYNVISAILRGDGNSKMPMVFVGIACIVNVIGDLVLTGVCRLGVTGVAVSTVGAQLAASLAGLVYLKKAGLSFPLTKHAFAWSREQTGKILSVGLPLALQDTLINLSFIAITVVANLRGVTDASAVGVVEKLITLMFLFPSAMMSALSAITSQNVGAGKQDRAVLSVKYGMALTALFGLICCVLAQMFYDPMASAFTGDPAVIHSAGQYLRTYTIDCVVVSFTFCVNGYLCGIDRSVIVFLHNTISVLFVRVPLAVFLSLRFPDTMLPMGLASPLGSCISVVILIIYFVCAGRKKKTSGILK